jgi:hypothetical protein
VPQLPQFAVLVWRLTSQPLEGLPSQLPKFSAQLATAQAPALHAAVALARLHAAPQRPQLAALVLRLTSQPLPLLLSQLAKPLWQLMLQVDDAQVPRAFAGTGQVTPQPPQLSGSVVGSMQLMMLPQ